MADNDNEKIKGDQNSSMHQDLNQINKPQQVINLPLPLILIVIFLLSVHIIVTQIPSEYIFDVFFYLAFIPQRITQIIFNNAQADTVSKFATFYTLITYTFLHGGWDHLLLNMAGIVIFGKLIILRLGLIRFLLFSVIAAIFTILVHYSLHIYSYTPVIGISGVIYAYIGAATRFILYRRDIALIFRIPNFSFDRLPRLTILNSLIQKTNFAFISFLIFINLILPRFFAEYNNMAYEAHLAGLFFGVVFFNKFHCCYLIIGF